MLAEIGCLKVNLFAPTRKREAKASRSACEALAASALAADHVDGHVSETVHPERARACGRQVDYAPADKRPAIVDAHHDRPSGLMISDPNAGPQRQGLMGGRQTHGTCISPIGSASARIN